MSFNELEISNQDGKPVWLYEFRLATRFWRYTSADRDYPWGLDDDDNPIIWTAKAIFHEEIVQGGGSDDLQVPMQRDLDIVPLFRVNSPSQQLWLTIRRRHDDDPDDEAPIAWIGTVGNVKEEDAATARAYCISIAATFDRNGVWLGWGRNCPYALYGRGCRVPPVDHAYEAEIVSTTGTNITILTGIVPTEGSFTGGYFEWDRGDGVIERRGIEVALSETEYAILGIVGGLPDGTTISMYPGCARDTPNCKLFDNLPNYGGFPHLPGKSPFDGTPVF